jgi:HNH endonuclease
MGPTPKLWQDRLIPEPNSGCWLWDGAVTNDGYGQVRINNRNFRVHRLAWEQANGLIPEGLSVLHKCDVPSCCNPDHLFLGTQLDNVTDMRTKRRFKGGSFLNALKTHCPNGHQYTEENTYLYNGMRSCKACSNARALDIYYRRKARP